MTKNPIEELSQTDWDSVIYSIIKPYIKYCQSLNIAVQDLQQEAWVALLMASQRYDPTKSNKFLTYAYKCIKGQVLRCLFHDKDHQCELYQTEIDNRAVRDDNIETEDIMRHIESLVVDKPYAYLLTEYFVKDKSLREIAKTEGVSYQAIKNRLDALIGRISQQLNKDNAENPTSH